MKLVCFETARMEAVRVQQLPYVFQRLPLNPCGNLPLSEVRLSLNPWPVSQHYPTPVVVNVRGKVASANH